MTKNKTPIEVPEEWKNRQTSNRLYDEKTKLAVVDSARKAIELGASRSQVAGAFKIGFDTLNDWMDKYSVAKKYSVVRLSKSKETAGIHIPDEWKNRQIKTVPWRNPQGKKIARNVYAKEVKIAVAKACHLAIASGVQKKKLEEVFCYSIKSWMEEWPASHFGVVQSAATASKSRSRSIPPTVHNDVMIHVGEDGYKYMDVKHLPDFESGKAKIIINFPDGMRVEGMSKEDLSDFLSAN